MGKVLLLPKVYLGVLIARARAEIDSNYLSLGVLIAKRKETPATCTWECG